MMRNFPHHLFYERNFMEDIILIEYKWNSGVYQLKDMIKLVEDQKLTKQEFFDITRYNYNGVTKNL